MEYGMGFLDSIERLITEHGSAAILRERISLANDEYALLEKRAADLQLQNDRLSSDNSALRQRLKGLEDKVSLDSNPQGYVCDHCGSPQLKRVGSRPDPTFGDLGIKQAVFDCVLCEKQSAFTQTK
jgi:hypothetical protein